MALIQEQRGTETRREVTGWVAILRGEGGRAPRLRRRATWLRWLGGSERTIFVSILAFLINIREMNSAKTFFQDMSLFSRASPSGVIYEGVAPCALA
jgi:hypothetical protein